MMRLNTNSRKNLPQELGEPLQSPTSAAPQGSAGPSSQTDAPNEGQLTPQERSQETTTVAPSDTGQRTNSTTVQPATPAVESSGWVQDYWPFGMLLFAGLLALYLFFRSRSGPSFRHPRQSRRRSHSNSPDSTGAKPTGQFKKTERFNAAQATPQSPHSDTTSSHSVESGANLETEPLLAETGASEGRRDLATDAQLEAAGVAQFDSSVDSKSSNVAAEPLKSIASYSGTSPATTLPTNTLTSNLRRTELTMTDKNPSDEFDFELEDLSPSPSDASEQPLDQIQPVVSESLDDSDEFDFEFDDSSEDLDLSSEDKELDLGAESEGGAVPSVAAEVASASRSIPETLEQDEVDPDFDLDFEESASAPSKPAVDPAMDLGDFDFGESGSPVASAESIPDDLLEDVDAAVDVDATVNQGIASAQEVVEEQALAISQHASDLADSTRATAAAGLGAATAATQSGGFFSRLFGFLKRKPKNDAPAESVVTPPTNPEPIDLEPSEVNDSADDEAIDLGSFDDGETLAAEPINGSPDLDLSDSSEDVELLETTAAATAEPFGDVTTDSQANEDEFGFDLSDDSEEELDFGDDLDLETPIVAEATVKPNTLDSNAIHSESESESEEDSDEFDFELEETSDSEIKAAGVSENLEVEAPIAAIVDPAPSPTTPSELAQVQAELAETTSSDATDLTGGESEFEDDALESVDHQDELIATPEPNDQSEKLAFLTAELESVSAEKEQLESELVDANRRLAEGEAVANEMSELNSKNAELEKRLSELQNTFATRETELSELNASLEAREKALTELKESNAARETELSELNASFATRDAELAELKAKLIEAEKQLEEAASKPSGGLMATGLAAAAAAGITSAGEGAETEGEGPMSQAELDDLKDRFQKRLKQEHRKRKQAQAELDQAEQQRNEVAAALRAAKKELVQLRSNPTASEDDGRVQELEKKLQDAESQKTELTDELQQIKKDLEVSKREFEDVQAGLLAKIEKLELEKKEAVERAERELESRLNQRDDETSTKSASPQTGLFAEEIAGSTAPAEANSPNDHSTKSKKQKDNLTKIRGIGKVIAKKLNELGVDSFEQISNWKDADVKRIEKALSLSGRVNRDQWIQQAKGLVD